MATTSVDLPEESKEIKRKPTVKEKKKAAWLKSAKYLYPDNKIAVLVGISDYRELRAQNENYAGY